MGAGQRLGPLQDPRLEFVVHLLQRRLRGLAFGRLALQRLVEVGEGPRLAEQLDEDADLGAQDVGVDRLAQVVDGADAVALQHLVLVGAVRGEEEYRDVLGSLARLDEPGQLDAGHAGHADVEDDRREVVSEQRQQRLVRRMRPHQDALGRRQHRLERVEVARLIVDDQDLGRIGHLHHVAHRYSHTRSSDNSWSVFTGLAM